MDETDTGRTPETNIKEPLPRDRAWRRAAIRAARERVNADLRAKATPAPNARDLFARRHAVLRISEPDGNGNATVTYLRACTCPIGAPHTEKGEVA